MKKILIEVRLSETLGKLTDEDLQCFADQVETFIRYDGRGLVLSDPEEKKRKSAPILTQ